MDVNGRGITGRFSVSEELASGCILETSLQLSEVTVVAMVPISQMGLLRLRERSSCSLGLDPGLGGFMCGGLAVAPQSFHSNAQAGNSVHHSTRVSDSPGSLTWHRDEVREGFQVT